MIFCFPFVLVFRIKLIVRLIGSSAYNGIAFHFSAGDDGDVKMGTMYDSPEQSTFLEKQLLNTVVKHILNHNI